MTSNIASASASINVYTDHNIEITPLTDTFTSLFQPSSSVKRSRNSSSSSSTSSARKGVVAEAPVMQRSVSPKDDSDDSTDEEEEEKVERQDQDIIHDLMADAMEESDDEPGTGSR